MLRRIIFNFGDMLYKFFENYSDLKENRLCFNVPDTANLSTNNQPPESIAEDTASVVSRTRQELSLLNADISTIDEDQISRDRLTYAAEQASLLDTSLESFEFSKFKDKELVINTRSSRLNYRDENGAREGSIGKGESVYATGNVKFFRIGERIIPFLEVKRNEEDTESFGYMAEPYLKLAPDQTLNDATADEGGEAPAAEAPSPVAAPAPAATPPAPASTTVVGEAAAAISTPAPTAEAPATTIDGQSFMHVTSVIQNHRGVMSRGLIADLNTLIDNGILRPGTTLRFSDLELTNRRSLDGFIRTNFRAEGYSRFSFETNAYGVVSHGDIRSVRKSVRLNGNVNYFFGEGPVEFVIPEDFRFSSTVNWHNSRVEIVA